MERLKGGLDFMRRLRKKKKRPLQKSKGLLFPGIRFHGLAASLDRADDRPAVHHCSLLCCCQLSHVGAKVRVYYKAFQYPESLLNFVF